MPNGLVDFHCHLDLYPNIESAIINTELARVYTLSVTTTPLAWPRNRDLTIGRNYVHSALGLHPQLVAERASELSLWEKYLNDTCYIGEVGLDASPRYYKSFELQKSIFKRILECCAEAGGKVLTVHSVRSVTSVLDYIEAFLPKDRGHIVLHWFTGNTIEAIRAVELGCFFSINIKMLGTKKGNELISIVPIGRILTETDRPFNEMNDFQIEINRIIKAIAVVKQTDSMHIKNLIYNNLLTLIDK